MQVENHAAWNYGFPVKYLLVREDDDGEDQLWGQCAGVEGLFADPVPPKREVLTLRACAPMGVLLEAVSRPGKATDILGDVCVEISDDRQPVQWWNLVDAVVIAHRPNPTDPALVDIIVGAGVEEQHQWSALPASPRFELFAGTTAAARTAGRCLGVDGLFAQRSARPKIPMELIGCKPTERLLSVLRRPRRWERDWAELWALDQAGRVMARHVVGLSIGRTRPSVLGGTLIDITLTDGGDRPSLVARPIWEAWYRGVPTTLNQWAPYTSQGRAEWLDLTAYTRSTGAGNPDRSGGVHHLDGRFITDIAGLHCAMGEALVGPGGYFGREWNAFKDCLCGGFGVAPPFTLIWHDADTAREALADVALDPDGRLSYFEEIVQLLKQFGVTVVLQ